MKHILNITLFFVSSLLNLTSITAQTDAEKAQIRLHVTSANNHLQNKDWNQALESIEQAQKILGSSSAIFEFSRIKAHYGKENYRKAAESVIAFFNSNPSESLITEITPIALDINKKIEAEDESYNSAIVKQSVSLYQAYLDKHPYGKYRSEIKQMIDYQKEEDTWAIAVNENTPLAYHNYVVDYPFGKYTEEANNIIENEDINAYKNALSVGTQAVYSSYLKNFPQGMHRREIQDLLNKRKEKDTWKTAKKSDSHEDYNWYIDRYPDGKFVKEAWKKKNELDRKAFEKAVDIGTQKALKEYLNNYSKDNHITRVGNYRSEVEKKLELRVEYDLYTKAQNSSSLSDFEYYVRQYPNGVYTSEANEVIKNEYITRGNEFMQEKKYRQAVGYYEKFLENYPNDLDRSMIERNVRKSKRKYNMRNLPSRGYFSYHFSRDENIGISMGAINNRSLGWYASVRFNRMFFTETGHFKTDNDETLIGDFSPIYPDVNHTGKERHGIMDATIGITNKIVPLLWWYAGVGLGYHPMFWELDQFDNNGEYHDTFWSRNIDKTNFYPVLEAGLIFDVFGLNMGAGIATRQFQDLSFNFRIGFSIKRYSVRRL